MLIKKMTLVKQRLEGLIRKMKKTRKTRDARIEALIRRYLGLDETEAETNNDK